MRPIILLLSFVIIQLGCFAGHKAYYFIHLSHIDKPIDDETGKPEISNKDQDEETDNYYEDESFLIEFSILSTGILFYIKNKTDTAVKIVRAKLFYVDINVNKHRVVSKYSDFENKHIPENPFLLKANNSFGDLFSPVDFINYNEKYGWRR